MPDADQSTCANLVSLRAIRLVKGDLTKIQTDAIVNAANPALTGGGGVDGAIHAAAGPKLLEACLKLPEVAPRVRCPFGQARLTFAYGKLKCHYVIHAVGPIYKSDPKPALTLAQTYRAIFRCAAEHKIQKIALPAISCGVYGFPMTPAARIALRTASEHFRDFQEISFCLFSEEAHRVWTDAKSCLISGGASRPD